jgi:polyhydroxyalkanoate synthesis regulator phasin
MWELEERWKESERRTKELSYQVGVLSEAKKNLEEELERERRASSELRRFLDEARKEVEEERARVRELEEELGFEKSKRHELESKCAALEHTVNALYSSWSWRITYPLLRLGLDVLRAVKKAFFYSVFKIWQIVTYPPKWILARAIKFVLRRPGLREFLHRQLIRFPRIYWGLYNFAVSRGIFADETIQTTMNSVSCLPSNTESDPVHNLSPRALQIYKRLKRAVEYYQSKVS